MNQVRPSACAAAVFAACLALPAFAGTFQHSQLTPGQRSDAGRYNIGSVTITQNATSNITALNSVACTNNINATLVNSYMRRFVLDVDNGIVNPFQITRVDFGVEESESFSGTQPLQINLYQIAKANPLTFANLTLLSSTTIGLVDQSLDIVSVPVNTTLSSPTTTDLVVEVFSGGGQIFFIGSNSDGQTHPCYLASGDCGIPQPTDIAVIGFPQMMTYMGLVGAEIPTAAAKHSWGSIKTLYR